MDNHIPQDSSAIDRDSALKADIVFNDVAQREVKSCPESYPEINYEDRRQQPRSIFSYPVEINIFSIKSECIAFSGYLRDVSMSGACLEFEDKYGRCNMNEIKNTKIRISFTILEREKVDIFAQVKWITKADDRTMALKMGIEFKYMESWDAIDKLIGMKNKDRNMMWNLWEQFF